MWIATLFQRTKLRDGFLPQKTASRLGGGFAVLGKVESSAGIQRDTVKIAQHLAQRSAIGGGYFEVQRQREAIYGVREKEIIGTVTLGYAEVGWQGASLCKAQHLAPGFERRIGG